MAMQRGWKIAEKGGELQPSEPDADLESRSTSAKDGDVFFGNRQLISVDNLGESSHELSHRRMSSGRMFIQKAYIVK
jgi:hypothetical protein